MSRTYIVEVGPRRASRPGAPRCRHDGCDRVAVWEHVTDGVVDDARCYTHVHELPEAELLPKPRICREWDCERPAEASGFCVYHEARR